MTTLYTVGHSNHSLATFLALLSQHGIEAIADVRSMPYSRHVPHFNPSALRSALSGVGLPMSRWQGVRRASGRPCLLCRRCRVSYARLVDRPEYGAGLERVRQGLTRYRLALMCTEKDPLDRHRMVLICRQLRQLEPGTSPHPGRRLAGVERRRRTAPRREVWPSADALRRPSRNRRAGLRASGAADRAPPGGRPST